MKKEVLFKKFQKKDGSGEHLQLLVPRSLKADVLYQMHDSVISGHLGCKKKQMRRLFRSSIGTG